MVTSDDEVRDLHIYKLKTEKGYYLLQYQQQHASFMLYIHVYCHYLPYDSALAYL